MNSEDLDRTDQAHAEVVVPLGDITSNETASPPILESFPQHQLARHVDYPIPMHLQEKIGSNCCGFLCDYRRAVFWANSGYIGFAVFLLMSRSTVADLTEESYEDDAISDPARELVDNYYAKRSIGIGVALGTALFSQIGAMTFRPSLIALHVVALVAEYVIFCFLALDLFYDLQDLTEGFPVQPRPPVLGFLVNTAVTLLVLYPHCGFLLENRIGILTAETYPRESYSCCCLPKVVDMDLPEDPEATQVPPPPVRPN